MDRLRHSLTARTPGKDDCHGMRGVLPRLRAAAGRGASTATEEPSMLVTILIVLLILALIGGLPTWGYSRSWGYGPSGIVGVILVILVVLWLLGRI
jgi:hypothetical protein